MEFTLNMLSNFIKDCSNSIYEFDLLNDDPPMPGLFYDFDYQCRFTYGSNSSHCKNRNVYFLIHSIYKNEYTVFL